MNMHLSLFADTQSLVTALSYFAGGGPRQSLFAREFAVSKSFIGEMVHLPRRSIHRTKPYSLEKYGSSKYAVVFYSCNLFGGTVFFSQMGLYTALQELPHLLLQPALGKQQQQRWQLMIWRPHSMVTLLI